MTFEEYCKENEFEPKAEYKTWFENGAREVANEICALFGITAFTDNERNFLKANRIIADEKMEK